MLVIKPVVPVRKPQVNGTIEAFKAKYPKEARKYIKMLKACTGRLLTVKEIYAWSRVQHPNTTMLTDLIRLGYMERYQQVGIKRQGRGKLPFLYHTTEKGEALAAQATC
jgi:hypothetical protein